MLNSYSLELITAPSVEPITIDEAKLHIRSHADIIQEDDAIDAFIKAAREAGESFTNRAFVTQTWKAFFDYFPCWEVELPNPPLQSVTHVKYIDGAGVLVTLVANTDYVVDTTSEPGRIYPAYGKTWPSTRSVPKAVEIQFVCGYGGPEQVPASIKTAMKQLIASFDANRETVIVGQNAFEVPHTMSWLLYPHRIIPV
jgi:uncharacterized phiE125 gp8 family phage protein